MDAGGFKVPAMSLAKRARQEHGVRKTENIEKSSPDSIVVPMDTSSTEHTVPEPDTSLQSEVTNTPQTPSESIESQSTDPSNEHSHTATTHNQDVVVDSEEQSSPKTATRAKPPPPKPSPPPAPPLPYTEPHWSGDLPSTPYLLSVIKNGTIIQEIDISKKPYHVFGRLPSCDVPLEHPSISRYHAVLQYRAPPSSTDKTGEKERETDTSTTGNDQQLLFSANPTEEGFYVYDLGSTHGSFVNKSEVRARCYYRLRVGQMVKFGGSSRLFLLECRSGGQDEVEADAEAEIREIVRQKEEIEKKRALAKAERERVEREREEAGASWGMVLDDLTPSVDEPSEEYHIDEDREAYYKEDPKKALKKFFDREGLELEYETEEEGTARARVFTVRVRLPIETAAGSAVYAEASVKGKKKEAVVQCALNACRMLDAQDMLRHHVKVHKRKERNWEENDYYDSEEDTFLDRTGTIEKKRKKRMKNAGAAEDQADNYQTLQTKLSETQREISQLETRLKRDRQGSQDGEASNGDSLENYMRTVGDRMDKVKRSELKHRVHDLKKEEERLKKLIGVVMPASLPELSSPTLIQSTSHHLDKTGPSPERSKESTPTHTHTPLHQPKEPTKHQHTKSDTNKNGDNKLVPQTSLKTSPVETKQRELDVQPKSKGGKNQREQAKPEIVSPPPQRAKRKARVVGPSRPPGKQTEGTPESDKPSNFQDDPEYCDWLPPEHQTGDGKTHLNAKFGY